MTRLISNPYRDRALSLNVFQILKHFSLKTELSEIRPILIVRIEGLEWDDNFITSHVEFLQYYLLDSTLVEELPRALNGAKPIPNPDKYSELIDLSKKALYYLFENPNIFNVYHIQGEDPQGVDFLNIPSTNPNLVSTSFDPQLSFIPPGSTIRSASSMLGDDTPATRQGRSAFWLARRKGLARFYTVLQFIYTLYLEHKNSNTLTDIFLLDLVRTLRDEIDTSWENITGDLGELVIREVKGTDDNADAYIEIFRRLSGFRSIVRGFIQYRQGS